MATKYDLETSAIDRRGHGLAYKGRPVLYSPHPRAGATCISSIMDCITSVVRRRFVLDLRPLPRVFLCHGLGLGWGICGGMKAQTSQIWLSESWSFKYILQ